MSDKELPHDLDWLLAHPEGTLGSKYHDAASCWQLIDALRERLCKAMWYKEQYVRMLDAVTPYLQTGGTHAHLMKLGTDLIVDGVPALCREIDRLKAELKSKKEHGN